MIAQLLPTRWSPTATILMGRLAIGSFYITIIVDSIEEICNFFGIDKITRIKKGFVF